MVVVVGNRMSFAEFSLPVVVTLLMLHMLACFTFMFLHNNQNRKTQKTPVIASLTWASMICTDRLWYYFLSNYRKRK